VELNQLQHQQQEAVQQQQVQQRLQQQQEPGSEYRMVLLRLDHMRDRVGYTATIKQWTAELHLTGGANKPLVGPGAAAGYHLIGCLQ
jgi:hypothetical protein